MKQKIENYLYEQIKENLSKDLQERCVKGHSNNERPMPYIYVNISAISAYEGTVWNDKFYNATLNIEFANDFNATTYARQSKIRAEIEQAVNSVNMESSDFIFYLIKLEESLDERDNNNIIDVLNYKLVVNYIPDA